MKPQTPMIVESTLYKPRRWFVVTSYAEKAGINTSTGEPTRYIVARKKFDVTDQIETILKAKHRAAVRKERG